MKEISFDTYDWGNLNSPWIGAEPHIWDYLIKNHEVLHYPAKTTLFSQDDLYHDAFVILSGRVRHTIYSEDGQERQLFIACPGAIIGETSCILSSSYPLTATTIVPTDVVRVPSKKLKEQFHNDPYTADLLLQYEARTTRMLITQQASLNFDSVEVRVAKHLLCLCETYGKQKKDGIHIGIRFTCSDLALLIGATRVTTNNVLLDFQKNGYITKKEGNYIVLDIDALACIAHTNIKLT